MTTTTKNMSKAALRRMETYRQHNPTLLADPHDEPPIGSVLMLDSLSGTAVQRMGSTGAYRSITGSEFGSYAELFKNGKREVYLIHTAPVRLLS